MMKKSSPATKNFFGNQHEDAVLKQLTYGCNSKKQVQELQRVYRGEIKHNDPALSISQHFVNPGGTV